MNITGLFFSYILLIFMFFLCILLPMFTTNEITRKIIHICTSNWWIIAMIYFKDTLYALIPPVSFLFLNYLSYRYNLVKAIERENKHELGTIYYPLSLIILVLFSFGYLHIPHVGAIGVLVMGYGDGFATIIGTVYGKKKLYKNKTYIGSISMLIISFFTSFILLFIFNNNHIIIYSLIISLTATIVELFSCKGLDNLTVPLITSLVYYLLIYI